MNICFAAARDDGIESPVYNHFGSAPVFIMVNTELQNTQVVGNKDQHHVHGACNPIMAMDGQEVDAVVVGGIGAGALTKLNRSGIKVYRSIAPTVRENLELLKDNRLPEFTMQQTCAGHAGGCGH